WRKCGLRRRRRQRHDRVGAHTDRRPRWSGVVIGVLIVDDHDIVRDGIKQIVSETSDIAVAGEAHTGAEAIEKLRKGGCDVVILDLNLPDRPGLDVLTQMRAIAPQIPVLILSMHNETSYVSRTLQAGALGYVSKN